MEIEFQMEGKVKVKDYTKRKVISYKDEVYFSIFKHDTKSGTGITISVDKTRYEGDILYRSQAGITLPEEEMKSISDLLNIILDLIDQNNEVEI